MDINVNPDIGDVMKFKVGDFVKAVDSVRHIKKDQIYEIRKIEVDGNHHKDTYLFLIGVHGVTGYWPERFILYKIRKFHR